MRKITHSYLWKAAKLGYVILPPVSCSPVMLMGAFKSVGNIHAHYIAQQDGSRLKVVDNRGTRAAKTKTDIDLLNNITHAFVGREPIWPQTYATKDKLMKYIKSGVITKDTHAYTCVWLHTFLNGSRVIPLLADLVNSTFYDLSPLFDKCLPEDDYGVIAPFDMGGPILVNLAMPHTNIVPTLVDYQDTRRMCHICGRVADISKPLRYPWLTHSNSVYVAKTFKETHGEEAFAYVADFLLRKKLMTIRHKKEKDAMLRERFHLIEAGLPISTSNTYVKYAKTKPALMK